MWWSALMSTAMWEQGDCYSQVPWTPPLGVSWRHVVAVDGGFPHRVTPTPLGPVRVAA